MRTPGDRETPGTNEESRAEREREGETDRQRERERERHRDPDLVEIGFIFIRLNIKTEEIKASLISASGSNI